jgi:hypothetical protein
MFYFRRSQVIYADFYNKNMRSLLVEKNFFTNSLSSFFLCNFEDSNI